MDMTVLRESMHRQDTDLPPTDDIRRVLAMFMVPAVKVNQPVYWAEITAGKPSPELCEHLVDVVHSLPADDVLDLRYLYTEVGPEAAAKEFMRKMKSMGRLKREIDEVCQQTLDRYLEFYQI